MPVYEYLCVACRSRFELLRPMGSSNADAECPRCQGRARRAISLFASFSKAADGSSSPIAGGGGCTACASGNCAHCSIG